MGEGGYEWGRGDVSGGGRDVSGGGGKWEGGYAFIFLLVFYLYKQILFPALFHRIRVCLVLPLWRDTEIKLDGDG